MRASSTHDPEQTSFTYVLTLPEAEQPTSTTPAFCSAFEFFAIVCGFDLKIVGHHDVVGIVGVVTNRSVVGHSGNPALRRLSV